MKIKLHTNVLRLKDFAAVEDKRFNRKKWIKELRKTKDPILYAKVKMTNTKIAFFRIRSRLLNLFFDELLKKLVYENATFKFPLTNTFIFLAQRKCCIINEVTGMYPITIYIVKTGLTYKGLKRRNMDLRILKKRSSETPLNKLLYDALKKGYKFETFNKKMAEIRAYTNNRKKIKNG